MTQRLMDHILPAHTPRYVRTLASQVDEILALDADDLRHLWDPYKCPLSDLPYLAWALSVDLWDETWPETKKRSVIAQSFALHKLKGTEEGIKRHLDVVEASLVRTIAPPARGFYTPALTDQGRKAWLEGLPQVRIYPFLTRRQAPRKRGFYRGSAGIDCFYQSVQGDASGFFQKSQGSKLYGRRATFYDRGTEVEAQYNTFFDAEGQLSERVFIGSIEQKRAFYNGSFYGSCFWQASTADERIMSVRLSDDATQRYSAFSGAKVSNVIPERIYQGRVAPIGRRFFGRNRGFSLTSYGPRLIFDRISILDKTRLAERQKVRSFWGHSRYGIAPYTAELLVEIPMKRSPFKKGTFATGFWGKASMKPLNNALEAIHTSKSLRDTILVDTQVHRPVQLSDGLQLGTFKLGEIRRLV